VPIILHLAKRPKQPWLVIHCSSAICIGNANDLLYFPFSRNERSPILAEIMCYRKILPLNNICGNNFVEHPKRNVFFDEVLQYLKLNVPFSRTCENVASQIAVPRFSI